VRGDRVEVCGDQVDEADYSQGVGVTDTVAATSDLLDQRRGRATVADVVAVLCGQIAAHEPWQPILVDHQCCGCFLLRAGLFAHHGGDEIVLRLEVDVEGAVGQPGVGHERGDARAGQTGRLQAPAGRMHDALPGRFLVVRRVAGHRRTSDPLVAVSSTHLQSLQYDHTLMIVRP
jgi:hypothetical protein